MSRIRYDASVFSAELFRLGKFKVKEALTGLQVRLEEIPSGSS